MLVRESYIALRLDLISQVIYSGDVSLNERKTKNLGIGDTGTRGMRSGIGYLFLNLDLGFSFFKEPKHYNVKVIRVRKQISRTSCVTYSIHCERRSCCHLQMIMFPL
jgi:hypothetical protein